MTLLTIVQDAAIEVGFPSPITVIGNTDQAALQMTRLLMREGDTLARHEWQSLKKEHTFTLVAGTQTYALPTGFRFIIPQSSWNRDNKRAIQEPLTSEEWQYLKGWSTVGSLNLRARIRNDLYEFEQTITAADNGKTIAFEYMSSQWIESAAGTAQSAFLLDTDVAILDEELLTQGLAWRFKKAKGLDWKEDFIEYTSTVNKAKARDGGSRMLRLGRSKPAYLGANTPEGNYGS